MSIKAIETSYAGCRFRSRLEARWAVFFDHLGIRWEYEPQGFLIGPYPADETDAGCTPATKPYLPDFLLDCGTWIEVKGNEDDLDKDLLVEAAIELPLIKACKEQGPKLMILGPIPEPRTDGDWGWMGMWPCPCSSRGCPGFNDSYFGFGNYEKNHRPWFLDNVTSATQWTSPVLDPYERGAPDAYQAARSARFEHGQNGAR
jgi:hypothetical protein